MQHKSCDNQILYFTGKNVCFNKHSWNIAMLWMEEILHHQKDGWNLLKPYK